VHSLFKASDYTPVLPGSSPFHFRGFYYDRLFARVKEMPGGMPRLLSELKDDRVRQFALQRFSWTAWYDALPTMPLYAAIARMEGTDITTSVQRSTKVAAAAMVPSVLRYAVDLRGGRGVIAAFVTKLVLHTVDFVTVDFEHIGAERTVAVGKGVPLFIAPSIVGLVLGGFEGVLRVSGADDIVADYSDVVLSKRSDGFETVSIRYDFSWRASSDRRPRSGAHRSRMVSAIANRLTQPK
jgi:hypothetical protein